MNHKTETSTSALTGQVALVTGSGRGIGRVIAQGLAAAGARVALLARSADELDETEGLIAAVGGRARAYPADVTNRDAVRRSIAAIERDLGPVDLLVNNAGISGPAVPAWGADPSEWWRCLEVNLLGPFNCCRLVLPGMVARRRGRIVNVASTSGLQAVPLTSAYSTSKAALIRLTECLAVEVAEAGVSVFAIQPGTVRTAMTEPALRDEASKIWLPWLVETFEKGRDVPPEEAARLVLFLASGRADALSGRFFDVADDAEDMVRRAEEVKAKDLYLLRMSGLRPSSTKGEL